MKNWRSRAWVVSACTAFAIAAGVSLGVGFGIAGPRCSSGVRVSLGPDFFCVPSRNVRLNDRPTFLDFLANLDDSGTGREALIYFSRAGYETVAPGYNVEKDIHGRRIEGDLVWIAAVNRVELQRYKYQGLGEKTFEDLWFGEGEWSNRALEPIAGTGWYRAFWFRDNRTSWQVLNAYPDRATAPHRQPDFWLASCHTRSSDGVSTCSSSYVLDDMQLDVEVGNLRYREDIARYIESQLRSWKLQKQT
jgi:hypothetical protein